MANDNTVYKINVGAVSTISNNSSTVFSWAYSPSTNGNIVTASTGYNATVSLGIPAGPNFNAVPFRIRYCGIVTLNATSYTIIPGIYLGTASTTGGNSVVATAVSFSLNNGTHATGSFLVEFEGMWDATSGYLFGSTNGIVGVNNTAPTTASAVNVGTSQNSLVFTPFLTFSTGSATNSATLTEFSIEQV